jgi:hypothetical protein
LGHPLAAAAAAMARAAVLAAGLMLAQGADALRVPSLSQALGRLAALQQPARGGAAAPFAPAASTDDGDALPDTFDTRLHWFGCGLTVLDQARAARQLRTRATHARGEQRDTRVAPRPRTFPSPGGHAASCARRCTRAAPPLSSATPPGR